MMRLIRQNRRDPMVPFEGFHGVCEFTTAALIGAGATVASAGIAAGTRASTRGVRAPSIPKPQMTKEQEALLQERIQTLQDLRGFAGDQQRLNLERRSDIAEAIEKEDVQRSAIRRDTRDFAREAGASGFNANILEESSNQVLALLRGEDYVNPIVEEQLKEARDREAVEGQRRFGAGFDTSSPGIERLAQRDRAEAETRFTVRENRLNTVEGISRAREGIRLEGQRIRLDALSRAFGMTPAELQFAGAESSVDSGTLSAFRSLAAAEGGLFQDQTAFTRLETEAGLQGANLEQQANLENIRNQLSFAGSLTGTGTSLVTGAMRNQNTRELLEGLRPSGSGPLTTLQEQQRLIGAYDNYGR